VRAGYGVFRWSPDETRILLKRAVEKKSGDLVWLPIPPLVEHRGDTTNVDVVQPTPAPIFRGLTFRDFAFSPDGKFIGVIAPGKRNLAVYPIPR